MDGYSGKRGAGGPKKGYKTGAKNSTIDRDQDQNARFCNRIGCSGRIKYTTQTPWFSSSNGNEMIENSSRSSSVMTRAKSSFLDSKRKSASQSEFDQSESSQSGGSNSQEVISSPSTSRSLSRHHLGSKNGNSSAPSSIRSRDSYHNKSESNKQNAQSASSVPSSSKSSGLRTLNSSSSSSSISGSSSSNNNSRYVMRNLKCNSISDIIPPSCSSSQSKSADKNAMKKKIPECESSLSRRGTQNRHFSASTSGISISSSGSSNFASGDSKGGAASIRARRSINVNNDRARQNGRHGPSIGPRVNVGGPRSNQQFSTNGSSSSSSSFSLSSGNNDNHLTMMPSNAGEFGFTHLLNHERYNVDGIAEVFLALERFEQDEELTHEQVLALETNLFLRSLNLFDQHRDMRLDIDNMSYEELLALEERMGTVSTALSEEALLQSVKKSIYETTPSEVRVTGSSEDGDDIKCSVCQEEYVMGDEIGKLVECRHGFHLTCINQWLRIKNWCPICKAAVAPQQSSSS